MITIYGIRNCDTCRKARKWLESQGIEHRFYDIRADGLDRQTLGRWVAALGWEALLNRRGTTWRQLPESARGPLTPESATALMVAHPTLIKRPVFEADGQYLVGFSNAEQAALRNAA